MRDAFRGIGSRRLPTARIAARALAWWLLPLHDRTKEVEAMLQPRDELHRITEALTRQRDQLRVKLHLARADARDEWGRTEKKWEHLKGRLSTLQETAEEISGDIGHAFKQLASEIEEGYERIRKLL
jgi:chromosome segregation ATPase